MKVVKNIYLTQFSKLNPGLGYSSTAADAIFWFELCHVQSAHALYFTFDFIYLICHLYFFWMIPSKWDVLCVFIKHYMSKEHSNWSGQVWWSIRWSNCQVRTCTSWRRVFWSAFWMIRLIWQVSIYCLKLRCCYFYLLCFSLGNTSIRMFGQYFFF